VKSELKTKSVSLKARFGRPDKAQPPSGNRCRGENAGWRWRLSGLGRFSGLCFCRPDKAKPPSGSGAAGIMPDGAGAYPAWAVSAGSGLSGMEIS